jgi:hypothetical protein
MQFKPKSESELSRVLPEGEYDFEIQFSEDAVSGASSKNPGTEMIKLTVALWDGETRLAVVFDYLLESVAYKLRHASDACGVLAKYESGQIVARDFEGKTGKLKLGIKKDSTGQYPDSNMVKDYICRKEQPKSNINDNSSIKDEKMPWD